MADIGKINTMKVVKAVDFGLYLDGGEHGEILLPTRYVPREAGPGDTIDVFLYYDSEDRLIATTERPYAMVGQVALLKVVSVTSVGAFLDWGLSKDLLLPFSEQKKRLHAGEWRTVMLFLDDRTHRIACSTNLDRFLDKTPPVYKPGEEVELYIFEETDLGWRVVVDDKYWGLVHRHEVYEPLKGGTRVRGYVREVRPDGKLDLGLGKPGLEKLEDISEEILAMLKAQGGFLPLSDKTAPEVIRNLFSTSKKNFKKALGGLYKKRLITIEEGGIRLV